MLRLELLLALQLLQLFCCHCFVGFWETNYNETITVCVFDELRGVLLGRTHWPDTEFNDDSAALQGALVTEEWFSGVGTTITSGAYTFNMKISSQAPPAMSLVAAGSFDFLNKEENGVWLWRYLRPPTVEECEQVTRVRLGEQ